MLRHSGHCRLPTLLSLASFAGVSSWLSALLWNMMTFDVYRVMLGLIGVARKAASMRVLDIWKLVCVWLLSFDSAGFGLLLWPMS